ncbi:hypothetical protein [Rhizobium leguminosarum]|jgi:hypothetical protein|uniref:hypothetical protein n=1 Tax=Rhizobium leguminosarum TaxID=384 RepID=UPI002E145901|nr:hypothetical protein U8Q02_40165 [Rhizobium leguminosarum]
MASKAYRQDYERAREAAYRYRHNPFEEGTRVWRLCEKARHWKSVMDDMDDEMEAVYGPFATKRPVIENMPGRFSPAVAQVKDSIAAIVDNCANPA